MKNTSLIPGAIAALGFTLALLAQQPAKSGSGHLGTWQLASTKYGDAKDFSDYPKERRRVKMITATHFTWVDYDTTTKKIGSSAGGPYTLKEGAYTETIEFVGEGMETYLDKKQTFTIKVDGDKLTQSGQLSDGLKLEEIWERVKSRHSVDQGSKRSSVTAQQEIVPLTQEAGWPVVEAAVRSEVARNEGTNSPMALAYCNPLAHHKGAWAVVVSVEFPDYRKADHICLLVSDDGQIGSYGRNPGRTKK